MAAFRKALVWEHFVVIQDGTKAQCTTCNAVVARGKAALMASLWAHLQAKHSAVHTELLNRHSTHLKRQREDDMLPPSKKLRVEQTTIPAVLAAAQRWSTQDPKAVALTKDIGKLFCICH